jgi:hypothetical protein
VPRTEIHLKEKAAFSLAAWRRRAGTALCGLVLLATTLSLQACSSPSSGSPASASHSGVQFYGTIDTGVGYERISN